MIVCKHCNTKNGLESRYCSSCGLEIGDDERDLARAEIEVLVAEGYAMLGQGRTEEAALVAEKALEEDPDYAEALSLLGMCHERNHDSVAALECYERVVELRPDSALDKIKVQQLRNAIARSAKEKPNRGLALVGAAAAMVLVGSIGGIVATYASRSAEASEVAANTAVDPATGLNTFTNNELNVPQTNAAPNTAAQNPQQGTGETIPQTGGLRQSNDGGLNRHAPNGTTNSRVLPDPSGLGSGGVTQVGSEEGNQPVQIGDLGNLQVIPSGGARSDGNDPTAVGAGGASGGAASGAGGSRTGDVTEPDDPNKGIEIKVHKGDAPVGGSQAIGEGGLATLQKIAQEQFLLGKYSNAASYYERVLRAGGDPGRTNQRLGQCYERLGRKGDAISAYTRAEAALASGGSKSALASVRQSLANLRGN